ncbi:DnaJ-domain-containing protein [Pluteus cervinus]|uniref:DnaJ-domain-containing protein n=1 Tax=Pluteus cervinus TaxID=181527 RepID=A0ACD3AFZ7_9AGAR|nr:DnaJ-domain-containing protein [Pluteus cervinus]
MSAAAYPLPSRPLVPQIATTCSSPSCQQVLEFAVPVPLPRQGTLLYIKCFKCQSTFQHAFYPNQIGNSPNHYQSLGISGIPSTATSSHRSSESFSGQQPAQQQNQQQQQPPRKGRKIGTQDRPLETGYYDILGVPVNATGDDIKKAYRRLAIKHHPDKNPDDPHAEERFKEIAIAYQTLSDETLRRKYNEFGPKESAPEGGFVDPEEVFGAIFGGEKFVPIIGHISLAKDMKAALQEADEEGEDTGGGSNTTGRIKDGKVLSEEEKAKKDEKDRKKADEKAKARAERVAQLVDTLNHKLGLFTEQATGPEDRDVANSWRTICEIEAEELKRESYGAELLQTIGFVYSSKAKHYLATNQTIWGMGGWLHNVQGKYHVFSETVSTLRSAIELKSVFDQIQAAEKAGNLSPEERKKLEEQAAEKGLQALFKGTKLEVESILREVCDRILEDPTLPQNKAQLRAVALQILGDAYAAVKKDSQPGDESEYVKVETKSSKAREAGGNTSPKYPNGGAGFSTGGFKR